MENEFADDPKYRDQSLMSPKTNYCWAQNPRAPMDRCRRAKASEMCYYNVKHFTVRMSHVTIWTRSEVWSLHLLIVLHLLPM